MSPAGDSFVGYASPAGQVRVIPGPAGGVPSTHILSPTARVPALAADAGGNAIAVWSETAGGYMAAGYDADPPQITGVTIPAVGRARRPGARVRLRVRRLGRERELGVRRRRHGAGGIRRAHVRAHRNVDVQVTATDGAGASATATRPGDGHRHTRACARPRHDEPQALPARPDSHAGLGPEEAPRAPRNSVPIRARRGRDRKDHAPACAQGPPCARPLQAARRPVPRRRRCTRYVKSPIGLTRTLAAGPQSVSFTGRVGRRKLAPGTYRAIVTATDQSANVSAARRVGFKVVR